MIEIDLNKNMVCHYTSTNVLCSMLQDVMKRNMQEPDRVHDQIVFWATHIRFLNDPSEYRFYVSQWVRELLQYDHKYNAGAHREVILKNSKYLSFMADYVCDPFVVSLCKKRDDLVMWNSYGDRGKGICLEFDPEKLATITDTSLGDCRYVAPDDTIFDDRELADALDYLKGIPDNPQKLVPISQWSKALDRLCCTKSKDYEHEAECRLVKNSERYRFTEKNGYRPYVEISVPIDALQRIVVGPCTEQADLAILGIQMMLMTAFGAEKVRHIDIIKSQKDFRNI